MKNLLIIMLSILPIALEIKFDLWRWGQDKDDKPLSTYLRVLTFAILAFVIALILPGPFWFLFIRSIAFLFSVHLLLFNYSLNVVRSSKKLSYRKPGEWWTEYTEWWQELGAKLWLAYVAWGMLFHWQWVQGNYPDTLIEYFLF